MSCSVGPGRCFALDANSSLLLLFLIYAMVAQRALIRDALSHKHGAGVKKGYYLRANAQENRAKCKNRGHGQKSN